jgi:hypothetical protein
MVVILNTANLSTGSLLLLDCEKPQTKLFQSSSSSQAQGSTSGGATPMPDSSYSSTPAWNPLARTPRYFTIFWLTITYIHCISRTADPSSLTPAWNIPPQTLSEVISSLSSPVASTSRAITQQDKPQHPLLDERLIGAKLKVVANGGEYKNRDIVVSIAEVGGCLGIRQTLYNTSTSLVHDWVTAKNPNPTRDNGLLVVIKGEHCGKYVRRIYHRYDDNNQALMILSVVTRTDGAVDTLTGEQLELGSEFLCLAVETQAEKKLNTSLMASLRKSARR